MTDVKGTVKKRSKNILWHLPVEFACNLILMGNLRMYSLNLCFPCSDGLLGWRSLLCCNTTVSLQAFEEQLCKTSCGAPGGLITWFLSSCFRKLDTLWHPLRLWMEGCPLFCSTMLLVGHLATRAKVTDTSANFFPHSCFFINRSQFQLCMVWRNSYGPSRWQTAAQMKPSIKSCGVLKVQS